MSKLYQWFVFDEDRAFHNRLMQSCIDETASAQREGIQPGRFAAIESQVEARVWLHPITQLGFPLVTSLLRSASRTQDQMAMTRIACALELFRLCAGEYPEELGALVPDFLAAIPEDVVAGQKFHYRRGDNGKFLLWSAGWNQTNDNGQAAAGKASADGDWGEEPKAKK